MKRETRAWVRKAEGDWRVAVREAAAADPVRDVVCFHCQTASLTKYAVEYRYPDLRATTRQMQSALRNSRACASGIAGPAWPATVMALPGVSPPGTDRCHHFAFRIL